MTSGTIEQAALVAPDISCEHCVVTGRRAVGALPGVQRAEASTATKQPTVTFDPSRVSVARIEEVLVEAGYPAQQQVAARARP